MRHRAVVAIGSNIDPRPNLEEALAALDTHPHLRVEAVSSLYQTKAVGPPGQPDFLNAAVVVSTDLEPAQFRSRLRALETRLGRKRTGDAFAPREIDLDLVLFDDVARSFEGWELPHPNLLLPHVLVPVAEVAGDWTPPGFAQTLGTLAESTDRSTVTPVG